MNHEVEDFLINNGEDIKDEFDEKSISFFNAFPNLKFDYKDLLIEYIKEYVSDTFKINYEDLLLLDEEYIKMLLGSEFLIMRGK